MTKFFQIFALCVVFTLKSFAAETIKINKMKTIFFVTTENIEFVDISNPLVSGIIEQNNPHILRLKIDPFLEENTNFDVTVVTERGLYNYAVIAAEPSSNETYNKFNLNNIIKVDPNKCLIINSESLSTDDFKRIALHAVTKKSKIKNISNSKFDLKYTVNNIYAIGDYVILDITTENKSNLQYDIEDVRFRLEDKKQFKATVSQEVELKPLFTLYKDQDGIIKPKRKMRNIYIFNKFTYPAQKTFIAEISEKGISGRKVGVQVDYNQLLSAKYLN